MLWAESKMKSRQVAIKMLTKELQIKNSMLWKSRNYTSVCFDFDYAYVGIIG